MDTVMFAAIFRGITYAEDGGTMLRLETQELTPDKKGRLGQMGGKYLYVAVKEDEIDSDIRSSMNKLRSPAPTKSQSQKLRHMLYRLYQKNSEGFENDEAHYDYYMKQFMKQVGQLLDE